MTKKIVLFQGLKSAEKLLAAVACDNADLNITYDARVAETIENRGGKATLDDVYHARDAKRMVRLEDEAHRMSYEAFEGVPDSVEGLGPAQFRFFPRTINYFLLATVRAYHLLKQLHVSERGATVWTTDHPVEEVLSSVARWEGEESPLPYLLKAGKGRWDFQWNFVPAPSARPQRPVADTDMLRHAAALAANGAKPFDVLFAGNPSLLNPIAAKLSGEYGRKSVFVRWLTEARHVLSPFRRDALFVSVPACPQGIRREGDLNRIHDFLKSNRRLVVENFDLLPALWPKLKLFCRDEIGRLAVVHERCKALLKKHGIRQVVVDEDVTELHRALVYAAKELGIPTLVMMHGLPGTPLGFVPLAADRMAAWGEFGRRKMIEWGTEASRIDVTGCPKYDALCAAGTDFAEEKSEAEKKLGFTPGLLALVLSGGLRHNGLERFQELSSTPKEIMDMTKYFLRVARATPTVNFVYKFRLAEWDFRIFDELLKSEGGMPANMRWVRTGSAMDWMRASDLVVNGCSSGGLEATLLNKPVVNMNFSGQRDQFPMAEAGLAVSLTDEASTFEFFRALADGKVDMKAWMPRQENLITEFLHARDGQSASRAAKLIDNHMTVHNGVAEVV